MAVKASEKKGKKQEHGISSPLSPRLYPLADAATYLGRSVYSLRTLIWNGDLPVIKSGKKMWVDIRDMDAWIERHRTRITA